VTLKTETQQEIDCPYCPAFSYVIGALTGAGGETVVQRVTEGASRIRPRPAHKAGGGGGLVRLAAALSALHRIGVAVTSETTQARVRIQATRAAVIQFV